MCRHRRRRCGAFAPVSSERRDDRAGDRAGSDLHVDLVHRGSVRGHPHVPGDDRARLARAAEGARAARAWTCAVTLIAFALGGSLIFKIFGITIGAFKIAGGVLIGLNALDMVQARRSQQRETPIETAEGIQKDDIGIMPLGVPMLAGPGAISTVMVLALGAKSTAATITVYVSIVLTALITYWVLSAASIVERRLGQTGMRILTRLMGLVLAAIAVQFIIDGIKLSFQDFHPMG
jgi:multiple antibiotic resistance protein